MTKLFRALVAASFTLCANSAALAGTATQSFSSEITLVAQALFTSATPTVNFATPAGVLTSNVDASTTLSVQGTNTTPYTIGINEGVGASATIAARKMTNGAATVTYSLYKDSGRTQLWGSTGAEAVSATATGLVQTYTVYGRVPPQATPAAGTYTDTLTITVTY